MTVLKCYGLRKRSRNHKKYENSQSFKDKFKVKRKVDIRRWKMWNKQETRLKKLILIKVTVHDINVDTHIWVCFFNSVSLKDQISTCVVLLFGFCSENETKTNKKHSKKKRKLEGVDQKMNATALKRCNKMFRIASESSANEMSSILPMIKPEIFLSDRSLVTVYLFIKNFIG